MRALLLLGALLVVIPSAGAGSSLPAPDDGAPTWSPADRESGAWAPAGRPTRLTIVLWPRGKQKAARGRRSTLRCNPPGGTLPEPARACRRLLALRDPFRRVPRSAVCTQIYGGPQVAEVRGVFRGRPLSSRFRRTDGCEIDRWNRVRFLFPA